MPPAKTLITYIKKLKNGTPTPEYKTKKSVGFDLAAQKTVTIPAWQKRIIETELVIKPPRNHWVMITPRSSLFGRTGCIIPNSPGVIDEDYTGPQDEVYIILYNVTNEPVVINKGDRVAQAIIMPRVKTEIVEDPKEFKNDETRGGLGSTGV